LRDLDRGRSGSEIEIGIAGNGCGTIVICDISDRSGHVIHHRRLADGLDVNRVSAVDESEGLHIDRVCAGGNIGDRL